MYFRLTFTSTELDRTGMSSMLGLLAGGLSKKYAKSQKKITSDVYNHFSNSTGKEDILSIRKFSFLVFMVISCASESVFPGLVR